MDRFSTDLVLLHPPFVHNIRRGDASAGTAGPGGARRAVHGLAEELERAGFNTAVVDLACRTRVDPADEEASAIAVLRPRAFAIDFDRLIHGRGALALARLARAHHPETPVIMIGLAASYYHRELIEHPAVDYVVRGDSPEAPLARLLRALRSGDVAPDTIPNLTWIDPRRGVVVNPLRQAPDDIDDIVAAGVPCALLSALEDDAGDLGIPQPDWLAAAPATLPTTRGCAENCVTCGRSRSAYRAVGNRKRPALRSPDALVGDLRRIRSHGPGGVLVRDLRQGGPDYAARFLELLSHERMDGEIVFELSAPADESYMERLAAAAPSFGVALLVGSQDEALRRLSGQFACSNEKIEATIDAALRHGARHVDLFFSPGMPGQTYDRALGAVDYCRRLLEGRGDDRRIGCFTAPLIPFLEPGSRAFEAPKTFGYILHYHTLEEHRRALESAQSWEDLLNYETETMSRAEIVAATRDTALGFERLTAPRAL